MSNKGLKKYTTNLQFNLGGITSNVNLLTNKKKCAAAFAGFTSESGPCNESILATHYKEAAYVKSNSYNKGKTSRSD